ncbi:vomeronasal type-1 receptor 4-like [Heterocephalus glaber]|uniref:Vomeronasal type-1 receptor n=1 Tax=Heterocephalus glaber TaxID=10181 RepID=A0AAX6QNB1_HETGA|nr:vomeronasal type-1 receptor 4-like [Heterocephalus glaber]
MFLFDTIFGFVLVSQVCVGVLGNSLLFVLYMCIFLFQPHLKKPIDSIFMHLTIVNILTITFSLLPDAMSYFGVKHFLNDVGCQAVLYIFRVSRGVSICTTSLLSTFQAITISPSNSKWVLLKSKLSMLIFPSFLFFWIINMLIYIHVIKFVRAKRNSTLVGRGYSHVYCEGHQLGNGNFGVFFSVILIRDLLFLVLMIWTSLYMTILLYRHQRRARHVHSPDLSFQTSREHKVIYLVLLLVSCFVFFFCSNNVLTIYTFYAPKKIVTIDVINGMLSSCFSTVCPFLLMRNNKIISQLTSCFSVMDITCFQRVLSG